MLFVVLFPASHAAATGLDVELYAQLLTRHTRAVADIAGTRVAYAALRRDPDWSRLVASLARAEPPPAAERRARLAFWINAYNILALDLVVQHHPRQSIRDIGSWLRPVWKRTAGRVGGHGFSLDEVESQILRPMGEPRIHGAIVCASLSCPPLARQPYCAKKLDSQLDANVRRWLADPRKGARLDAREDVLWLTPILDWFADDFRVAGGVRAFVHRYGTAEVAAWLRRHGDAGRIRFMDYDWSLNALPPGSEPGSTPARVSGCRVASPDRVA